MQPEEQMLVVGPSWVGDMVMAQSLFKELRERHPNLQIDVVAPGWSRGILARMPEVRCTFELAAGHGEFAIGKRRSLGHTLRDRRYDRAIVLPRSWKSALVPWFAKIPVRTGYRGEFRYGLLNDVRSLDKTKLDQTVKRFIALGLPPDMTPAQIHEPGLSIDPENQARLRAELGIGAHGKAVAMMPGAAYGPAKMWPLEHFAQLAKMLTEAGLEVWIIGSEAENQTGEEIVSVAGQGSRNLCGRTALADTPDLFAMTAAVVTNDSGLMHVAAAAGSHVIAIYGSTTPDFTPPLTAKKTIHGLTLPCRPCFKRECPLGHLDCLRKIKPDDILPDLMQLAAS